MRKSTPKVGELWAYPDWVGPQDCSPMLVLKVLPDGEAVFYSASTRKLLDTSAHDIYSTKRMVKVLGTQNKVTK